MPARIRVYELARQLGLSNKETLDLCVALGIGVKSHSSSIEDAQADRVRRKAEREGLTREVAPEEPPAAPAIAPGPSARPRPEGLAKAGSTAPGSPSGTSSADSVGATQPSSVRPTEDGVPAPGVRPGDGAPTRAAPPEGEAPAARTSPEGRPATRPSARGGVPTTGSPSPGDTRARPPDGSHRLVTSRPASELAEAASAERSAAAAAAERSAAAAAERTAAARAAAAAPPATGPARAARPPAPPGARAPDVAPPAAPGTGSPPAGAEPPSGPRSSTGKPIPPPPGLRSTGRSGPPSGGPTRSGPPGARQSAPARPGGAPRPGGGPSRPGTGGRPGGFGADRPAGGLGRPAPGAGAGRGGPGGGPGGRGGPGQGRRPPQRRRRRRRRYEELEPTQATTYTRSEEPVPDGEVVVERASTAQQLGPKLNRTAADVVRFLYQQGEMVTATQSLSDDMIELFAAEVGAEVLLVDPGEEQEAKLQDLLSDEEEEDESTLRPRPPVITVMGHVDHGKTLLLDRIRQTNVIAGEAGGITQHIGAYQAQRNDKAITFIDTPGHEAFTAMRARGAEATDVVVLLVAADDGVMPQTVEAINHAKAAEVPIVVAINKVDRDNADPTRVRQQLSEQGLVPEEWGGDTIMVEVSALQEQGIDDLLEQLLVVAEVEELRANPEGRARGVVLEANLDVGRGPVATVLVEQGTLQVGDPVVAGAAWGRVRALVDDRGDPVKEALPSMPVELIGLSDVPSAGDEFRVAPDDKTARIVAEAREQRYRVAELAKSGSAVSTGARLEDIFEQIQRGETASLNLILKADVHGSLEALTQALGRLERDDVKLAFVHRAVGGITENDVTLAAASNATIIGFNVRPDRKARELAASEDVEIRTYQIIYQILEDIEKAMVGLLAPEVEEVVTGEAEVREVFRVPKIGGVAGCYVRHGVITRGSKVRFLRDGVVIWTGTVSSLKRFKDDAREVATGFECGIGLSDFQDLNRGDIIETYEEREIPRT